MLRELIFTRAVTNMALVGPVGLYEGKQSRQTKQAHKHFFKWAKYHHFHKMSLKVELKYILCFVFCFVFFISRCAGSYKVYEMETNENCPDSLPFFCTNPDLPRCGCLALCCCLFMYLKTKFWVVIQHSVLNIPSSVIHCAFWLIFKMSAHNEGDSNNHLSAQANQVYTAGEFLHFSWLWDLTDLRCWSRAADQTSGGQDARSHLWGPWFSWDNWQDVWQDLAMTSRGGKEKPMILLGFVNYPLLSLPVLRWRNMRPHFHTWTGYHRDLNPLKSLGY